MKKKRVKFCKQNEGRNSMKFKETKKSNRIEAKTLTMGRVA